jgi:hypothetical protein
MNQAIKSALELYKFDNALFQERIGSLENSVAGRRVSDKANPIIWVAGHITNSRTHLLELFGTKKDFEWAPLFQEPYDSAREYPDISVIKEAWTEVTNELFDKLGEASDDQLAREVGYKIPHGDNTVRGAIVFLLYHEAWHLGQIAYIRKCTDMEGLVPY